LLTLPVAAFSRRQTSSEAVYVVVGPIVGKRATKVAVSTTEPAASTAGTRERRRAASTSSPAGSAMSAARVCVQRRPADTITPAAPVPPLGGAATSRSSTTTRAYAVASGLRKVETRRRTG